MRHRRPFQEQLDGSVLLDVLDEVQVPRQLLLRIGRGQRRNAADDLARQS